MRNEEPFVTYDYEIEKLKRYLKPVRTAFGVSGKELADILGISRITYMKYENGKKRDFSYYVSCNQRSSS